MPEKTWTVLVVDDDAAARERVTDLLTVAGFSVSRATNGARALEVLKTLPGRALVLLDLDMPVMTGQEFLIELLALPKATTRFPVLVVSGVPTAAEALKMPGVLGVLPKPFTGEQLIASVREFVNPVGRSMR